MNKKIKIIVVLILALILASYLNVNLFIANSPRINSRFLANIKLPGIFDKKTNNVAENIVFKPIEKGVYAADGGKNQYLRIVESEVDWVVIDITTNSGVVKRIKLSRKDSTNQEVIENLKKIL